MKIQKIWKKMGRALEYLRENGIWEFLKKTRRSLGRPWFYTRWLKAGRATTEDLEVQRAHRFAYEPLISILVPTYRTPLKLLREMLESVLAQSYENWELCIAEGSMGYPEILEVLEEYAQKDSRVRYRVLEENLGISGNTNQALEMAQGEFIGLLDHDDIMEPDALYYIVEQLQDAQVDIVYTDEDKVNQKLTRYSDPNLKPDFSPDLLRSHNYVTHFLVIRSSIIREVGGFRSEFDGAQDYDLLLRSVEKSRKIQHVARVLYHWRMCKGSTADNPENKLYCYEAGRKALEEHLQRVGLSGKVEHTDMWGMYHVTYDTPGNPLLSIIIPNKDHSDDLEKCILSLQEKSTYRNFEIIVVENNSTQPATFVYYENLQHRFENVKVVTWKGEFNYSAINNYGATFAKGDYFLLLNNDTELITPGALGEMLGICMREDVGVVGAKLLYGDDTVQHAGIVIGFHNYAGHVFHGIKRSELGFMLRARINGNFSAVTGACLMTSRRAFELVGGMTEELPVAGNDVDYCLKVRKKDLLVVLNPFSEWYHYESKSRGYEDTPEKKARFDAEVAKFGTLHGDVLAQGDPYYNKNFPIEYAPFTLG